MPCQKFALQEAKMFIKVLVVVKRSDNGAGSATSIGNE